MAQPTHFILPQVLKDWPYERRMNPYHNEVKAASDTWLESLGAYGPAAQKAHHACNFGLFSSMIYPFLDASQLRTGHDVMHLFFVLDECTDDKDGPGALRICDMVMDALRMPDVPRKSGEPVVAELARQFWSRAIPVASEPCQRRFVETFQLYVNCVVEEAKDRTKGRIRGIEEYMAYRRHSAGPYPTFAIGQQCLDLRDEVFEHPVLKELTATAGDLVVTLNDMYSYNMEQSKDLDGHNLITVVMHELGVSLQEAFNWVGDKNVELENRFLALRARLPRWGKDIDRQVEQYVDGLGYTIRGLYHWSFESKRYFGDKGVEIEKHRVVELLPKTHQS